MIRKMLKSQSGMTLIEIMVVVAIIASISGIVAVQVLGARDEASKKTTQTQIGNIMGALDQYKLDNHRYPSTEQGLDALVNKPSSGVAPKNYPEEGYLKRLPKDAWGSDYNYASPGANGNAVEVWSNGPDQEPDNEDDIRSWEIDEEK